MSNAYLEERATPNKLRELAQAQLLDASELKVGLKALGVFPGWAAWAKFLDRGLLVMGAAFVVSGVIAFFAFNWADMDRFLKFGLLGALILGGVIFASVRGLNDLPAKISLMGSSIVVGVLLAIIDQSYPSGPSGGAESYQLFLGWAALIAGWVIISEFIPLWFLLLGLLNAGVIAYWDQALAGTDMSMYVLLFSMNAIAVFAWELGNKNNIEWIKNRWAPRLAGLAAFISIVIPTIEYIADAVYSSRYLERSLAFAPLIFLAACGGTMYFYSKKLKDIFLLAAASFSLVSVITSIFMVNMDFYHEGEFLVMAVIILGQTALAVRWLRKVDESVEEIS